MPNNLTQFFDLFDGNKIILPIQLITFINKGFDRTLQAKHYNQYVNKKRMMQSITLSTEQFMMLTNEHQVYGRVGILLPQKSNSDNTITVKLRDDGTNDETTRLETLFGANVCRNVVENYFTAQQVGRMLSLKPSTIGKVLQTVSV